MAGAVAGCLVCAVLGLGTAPLWLGPAAALLIVGAALALVSAAVAAPVWLGMRLWRLLRPAPEAPEVVHVAARERPYWGATPEAVRAAAEAERAERERERTGRARAE